MEPFLRSVQWIVFELWFIYGAKRPEKMMRFFWSSQKRSYVVKNRQAQEITKHENFSFDLNYDKWVFILAFLLLETYIERDKKKKELK